MAIQAREVTAKAQISRRLAEMARHASLEIGSLDFCEFPGAQAQLMPGQRVYVSHLPGQGWKETFDFCSRLSAAGFEPVPHLPVRLLKDRNHLDDVLAAACQAGVREPLLISGDYLDVQGSYSSVLQVLQTGALQAHGFPRVSLAGHPEGHPRVTWDRLCEAQVEKWRLAVSAGLAVTFVTQFFFTVDPFIHWARYLRAAGVEASLVAGVAGPTGLGRLIKLAARCGVGASLRTLTSRPASGLRLLADHSPDSLLRELAAVTLRQPALFDGLHVFSLGGFARTAAWLRKNRLDAPAS